MPLAYIPREEPKELKKRIEHLEKYVSKENEL